MWRNRPAGQLVIIIIIIIALFEFSSTKCTALCIFVAKIYTRDQKTRPGGLIDPLGAENVKCKGVENLGGSTPNHPSLRTLLMCLCYIHVVTLQAHIHDSCPQFVLSLPQKDLTKTF